MTRMRNRYSGFSIIELSVVLAIIALIIGGGIAMTIAIVDKQGYDRTTEKLDIIQTALLNYALAHGYYPCPSDITASSVDYPTPVTNFGVGVGTGLSTPTNCTSVNGRSGNSVVGGLPITTLNLDKRFLTDGFGLRIRYAVDERMTRANAALSYPLGSAIGSLTVMDDSGTARTANAIYVLVSHGVNGHGGYPATGGSTRRSTGSENDDEQDNCDCDEDGGDMAFNAIFVQRTITGMRENASTNFDDVVRYSLPVDLSGEAAP